MKRRVASAALLVALLTAGISATAAYAEEPDDTTSVIIDGHEYGPEDGLTVVTESFEMTADGPVGATYESPEDSSARVGWGASYAYANEILQLGYVGYAKAAANVYQNQRIIQVCFYWTRGGVRLNDNVCSNASYSNGWHAGPEVTGSMNDTLDPNAPPTVFNIKTTRVDPGITG